MLNVWSEQAQVVKDLSGFVLAQESPVSLLSTPDLGGLRLFLNTRSFQTTSSSSLVKEPFREAIVQKIPEFYEILSQNGDPSPPYCFYEILIPILPLILGYLLFLNKRYEIRLTPPPRLWNYFIKFRYFFNDGFPYLAKVLFHCWDSCDEVKQLWAFGCWRLWFWAPHLPRWDPQIVNVNFVFFVSTKQLFCVVQIFTKDKCTPASLISTTVFLQMVCKDSSVNGSECAKVTLKHRIYHLSMICSNVPV